MSPLSPQHCGRGADGGRLSPRLPGRLLQPPSPRHRRRPLPLPQVRPGHPLVPSCVTSPVPSRCHPPGIVPSRCCHRVRGLVAPGDVPVGMVAPGPALSPPDPLCPQLCPHTHGTPLSPSCVPLCPQPCPHPHGTPLSPSHVPLCPQPCPCPHRIPLSPFLVSLCVVPPPLSPSQCHPLSLSPACCPRGTRVTPSRPLAAGTTAPSSACC